MSFQVEDGALPKQPQIEDARAGCLYMEMRAQDGTPSTTDFGRIWRLASLPGQSETGFENLRPLKAGNLA